MYFDRSADLGEAYVAPQAEDKPATKQFRCKVCGYIYEGEALPEKYVCPLCKRPASMFEEV
jgi:rubrerythrin